MSTEVIWGVKVGEGYSDCGKVMTARDEADARLWVEDSNRLFAEHRKRLVLVRAEIEWTEVTP